MVGTIRVSNSLRSQHVQFPRSRIQSIGLIFHQFLSIVLIVGILKV